MMEEKVNAIVLHASDKGESDKLLQLLSFDGQLIYCIMRGVKKANAKLKFGAQPFAFCEYILVGTKNKTVKSCSSLGDLYGISGDIDKYMVGCVMLECAQIAANSPDHNNFKLLIGGLKQLCYSNFAPQLVGSYYLYYLNKILGYGYSNLTPYSKVETPAQLISYISTSKLEDSTSLTIPEHLIKKTFTILANTFSHNTAHPLTSIKSFE